jgi:hypothetical protein
MFLESGQMGRRMILVLIVFGLGFASVAYVRLAPNDVARWHVPLTFSKDPDLPTGAQRVFETGPGGLALLDQVVRTTPRTSVLIGSIEDGRVTYVTRSRVMGFPDYTTAQQDGDILKVYGRLRFGKSDLGVNRARLEHWGKAVSGGTD